MAIKGLTDRGAAFPEIGQIRKGGKKGNNRPGKDLTYFRVEFDERETKAAETFQSVYGSQPTSIRIILPFDEIDRMWVAWLEAYTAGRMVARSDGEFIIYRVDSKTGEVIVKGGVDVRTGQPAPHPDNDIAGYDYKNNPVKFKPTGRLKVIIPELARAAYLTVLTTSVHDIANISDQLRAFQELNGGQIKGIPFILRRRPKKISIPNPEDPTKRMRVEKWMLSIEADPDWVKAKLSEVKRLALPENGLEESISELPAGIANDDEIEDGEYEVVSSPETSEQDQPEDTPEDIYQAIVDAGLSENVHAARNALAKCQTGFATKEIAIDWMRRYRDWRDVGVDPNPAAEKTNDGDIPID